MENTELSVIQLWNAASTFTKTDHVTNLIRSHLLTDCLSRCQYNFKLPLKCFGPNVRCSNCCTEWRENNYSTRFTKRKKLNKRSRRKYKLIAENRNGSRTEKEIQKAKNRIQGKILLIKCFHCHKTTKYSMPKEKMTARKEDLNVTPNMIHNKHLNDTIMSTNKIKLKTFKDFSATKKRRQLEKSCYNSPNLTPKSCTPNLKALKGKDPEQTPVLSGKKKRLRDKFAGLSKLACVGSTPPPKSDNPLHLLMKVRNVN